MLAFKQPQFYATLYCTGLCSKNTSFFSKIAKALRQRALVAYGAIEVIRRFNSEDYITHQKSIRELLLDRKNLNQLIVSLMNDSEKQHFRSKLSSSTQIDLGISQEAYQQVLSAFEITKGYKYNQKIWQQDRMRDACHLEKIVLFPASVTAEYFKMIHNGQKRLLSGSKGTGKSFSFMSYAYLSQFMIKYQVSLKSREQNSIQNIFKEHNWGSVRNLCYINIKPTLDYHEYFIQMMQQFENIYPIEQIKLDFNISDDSRKFSPFMSQILTFLSKYSKSLAQRLYSFLEKKQKPTRKFTKKQLIELLTIVQAKALKINIKTTCVIDEGNRIYRQLRELQKRYNKHSGKFQWQDTQQYKILTFYYELLEILVNNRNKTHFHSVIINSSQDFELQFAEAKLKNFLPEIYNKIDLLKLLIKQRHFGNPRVYINYSTVMNKVDGQIQLFNIFWFEMLLHFHRNATLGNQLQINSQFERRRKEHRKCFDQQFGLSSINSENKNILQIDQWKNQVRHLDIREYFREIVQNQSKIIKLLTRQSYFKLEILSENDKFQLKKDFRDLKIHIQQRRHDQMVKNIKNYIHKSPSNEQQFLRISYLRQIIAQAKKYLEEQKQIHFSEFVKYEYLSTVSGLEKKGLVQLIKFGFVEQKCLRFSMNPREIITVIMDALVDNQLMYIMAKIAKELLTDPRTSNLNPSLGKALDKISYPVFRSGHLELHYKQYQLKKNQLGFTYEEKPKIVSIKINKSYPILGLTNLTDYQLTKNKIMRDFPKDIAFDGWFDKVVEEADKQENFEKFIAGYPIDYYNIQKRKFGPFENNAAFDNVALRRVSKNKATKNSYQLQLYDWTMGRPGSKSSKNFKQIIEGILELVNLKADIKCTLLIVAPDYYVSDYFSKLKNNRNQKRPENLFWKNQYQTKIDGIRYKRDVCVSLAQFDENLPFEAISTNPQFTLVHNLYSQCYKYIKKHQPASL